ncbi:hypothetical protein chiPu_0030474, partial [Chiloscyllium punctatum]|nr:hypothetical protein [Chiloscyllium punctatum]
MIRALRGRADGNGDQDRDTRRRPAPHRQGHGDCRRHDRGDVLHHRHAGVRPRSVGADHGRSDAGLRPHGRRLHRRCAQRRDVVSRRPIDAGAHADSPRAGPDLADRPINRAPEPA